jgi:hypothetical protein
MTLGVKDIFILREKIKPTPLALVCKSLRVIDQLV